MCNINYHILEFLALYFILIEIRKNIILNSYRKQ